MASAADQNAILTDVSPGAPMHEMMRRYWLPACLSSDHATRDSDPKRVTMLGKDYVCFRDSQGKIGLLDEHCPHRGASLCLGKAGNSGLQCIYHGWRFAVDGEILEMPNVADDRLKSRIRQPAYPTQEAGGIVWAYVGPDKTPPLPHLPFFDVPDNQRYVTITVSSTNYTQVIEGVLDSSHVGVLHADVVRMLAAGEGPSPVFGGTSRTAYGNAMGQDLAPKLEVQDTDFGMRYAALRTVLNEKGEKQTLARVTAFAFPNSIFIPAANIILVALPVRPGRTHLFQCYWDKTASIGEGKALDDLRAYYGIDEYGMNERGLSRETHDLPDRPNRDNYWLQDREAMREGKTFSGLYRFMQEDYAVANSMGSVQNTAKQHLVPADIAVARYRRLMIENALRVKDGGEAIGLDSKTEPRSAAAIVTAERPWQTLFEPAEKVPA